MSVEGGECGGGRRGLILSLCPTPARDWNQCPFTKEESSYVFPIDYWEKVPEPGAPVSNIFMIAE